MGSVADGLVNQDPHFKLDTDPYMKNKDSKH